ncbi:MAG: ABC transporter transmembrane domain-containing protein, partial [Clostridia bacterium]
FIMRKSVPLYKKIQKNLDDTTQITQENLNGARVIRAFSKQDNQIEKFVENNAVMTKNNVKVGIISALLSPLSFAIVNLAIAAVIYFGGKIVNVGAMSQGQIIAFINYLMQISLAIVVVANLVTLYTRSYASAKRIEQVLTIDASTRPTLTVTPLKDCAAISFRQVCFGYSSNLVLSNINFEIFKGQNIGIIGGTGCGKSTIANLIAGFYAPT